MAQNILNQEPLEFMAGDTFWFQKAFQNFTPANGWTLFYEIRSADQPTAPAITINATADPTNTFFIVTAPEAQTAAWAAGESLLTGFVVNAALGHRHAIYENYLRILANLGTTQNQVDLTTHAQRMIKLIESQLESLAAHSIDQSDIQQVEIRRVQRKQLEDQLAWNKHLRMNEIAQENANNNRPSGNKIMSMFNIIPYGGPGIGVQNPFIPNT